MIALWHWLSGTDAGIATALCALAFLVSAVCVEWDVTHAEEAPRGTR